MLCVKTWNPNYRNCLDDHVNSHIKHKTRSRAIEDHLRIYIIRRRGYSAFCIGNWNPNSRNCPGDHGNSHKKHKYVAALSREKNIFVGHSQIVV